jgi:ABC-2 type transport system ATP-binding protein
VEAHSGHWDLFTFSDEARVGEDLLAQGIDPSGLCRVAMSLEDAFIGYTGRY